LEMLSIMIRKLIIY